MPKPRTTFEIILVLALIGALSFIFSRPEPTPMPRMITLPSVRFNVGGYVADAANSANAEWGEEVRVTSGSMWVEAAGDLLVICEILRNGIRVSEAWARGKGNRAVCAFGQAPILKGGPDVG